MMTEPEQFMLDFLAERSEKRATVTELARAMKMKGLLGPHISFKRLVRSLERKKKVRYDKEGDQLRLLSRFD